ncbi:hypothetical protein ACFQ6C_26260 [Streptomyces sp. NPDC056454]|uniref:hypothetical protein n=1 Tax=Streptomyces sp. NPDC056454 TaxID=3345823 RepID=UPI003683A2AB
MLLNLSVDSAYGKTAARPASAAAPQAPAAPPVAATTSYPAAATDLLDSPVDWTWRQLQDYVERAVGERHGPQPTGNEAKHAAIFQSFHKRWGHLAGPIARFAFEQQDGFWHSAPVTALRFTKGSDEYFARPISERLTP